MKNFIEELKWRGMLHDMVPETEALLSKGSVTGYIGFDPTADSLGVGNLVQVMMLLHFQECGHKPIALIGGATGMVGDPSGKSQERNLLSEDILQHNLESQKKQLEKFLNFDCGANSAEIVNNYDWFKNFSFLDFIRDVGKNLTVSYMMAKDSVQQRLESGMSFTEFSYQLVQGYDFFYLWKNRNVELQMGGSDQWGNIVTGTELIRRMGGGKGYALTTPLIKKADGTKFGKSESGNIWLDAKRTSPYQFYQFWLNASDEDVKNYIRIFTLFTQKEIELLEVEHALSPHLRGLQKALAEDITIRVHSLKELKSIKNVTEILFGNNVTKENLILLSENDLNTISQEIPTFTLSKEDLKQGISIIDVLGELTSIIKSKGEAKNAIKNNAISVNREKVSSIDFQLNETHLIKDKFIFIDNGKKNKYILRAE